LPAKTKLAEAKLPISKTEKPGKILLRKIRREQREYGNGFGTATWEKQQVKPAGFMKAG